MLNVWPFSTGLKPQDSNENEIVLDLALRWAGDADIALAIKLFSLQLSLQVRRFNCYVKIRNLAFIQIETNN